MNIFKKLKQKVSYTLKDLSYHREKKVKNVILKNTDSVSEENYNIVWMVFDSCRYDTLIAAKTPTIDSYAQIQSAWAPATYTLPSHISFFSGILPLVYEALPYYNRFQKQLIAMQKFAKTKPEALGKYSINLDANEYDIIYGLKKTGYYTVGAAGANWFTKDVLVRHFEDFQFSKLQSVNSQMNFILDGLEHKAQGRPFFGFMNLMETHTPYMHYGADREEYSMTIRSTMSFPPRHDPELQASKGKKLHQAQIEAAEYLDQRLAEFLPQLPSNTFVVVTADHGECFGEDGLWGHGIYHPKVMNVPMACFMLNGEEINE